MPKLPMLTLRASPFCTSLIMNLPSLLFPAVPPVIKYGQWCISSSPPPMWLKPFLVVLPPKVAGLPDWPSFFQRTRIAWFRFPPSQSSPLCSVFFFRRRFPRVTFSVQSIFLHFSPRNHPLFRYLWLVGLLATPHGVRVSSKQLPFFTPHLTPFFSAELHPPSQTPSKFI